MPKISKEIDAAVAASKKEEITVGDFIDLISVNGHMFPVTFFTFPFLLPIPIPGLSTIFGIVIMALGLAIILDFKPWIPQFIKKNIVSKKLSETILKKFAWLARKIENIIKPRLLWLSLNKWNYKANGLIIATCGFYLSLPLPPGTNFPPAINILILAVADIEDDGLLLLIGYFVFLLNIASIAFVYIYGIKIFEHFL